jgi:ABC-type Fe3+ transport system substrate-binding protein
MDSQKQETSCPKLSGAVHIIIKDAPHPNAATALVNWFASTEGQELYARTVLELSRRVDVPTSIVPNCVIPRSGVKYEIDQYTEEWQREVAPKLEERLQKALGR